VYEIVSSTSFPLDIPTDKVQLRETKHGQLVLAPERDKDREVEGWREIGEGGEFHRA
jgi:hypothetical protein